MSFIEKDLAEFLKLYISDFPPRNCCKYLASLRAPSNKMN